MKSKTLALANGIVGLAGGIALVFWLLFAAIMQNADAFLALFFILKLAILALGIIALVFYKGTRLVKTAAHVLFIVGGAVALIPLFGWIGGIIVIIGGALYLASLKNFKTA
jgi:hypothetical protein